MKWTAIRGYGGSEWTFCVVLVLLVSAWTVGCMVNVGEPTAPNRVGHFKSLLYCTAQNLVGMPEIDV